VNNTSGSGTGSGAVTVYNATLGGSGIISGDVTANSPGRISPGEANTNVLTAGSATFQSGSFFDVELGGTTFNPPTQTDYDRLAVTNAATINGGTLNVTLINGFMPNINDTFRVLTAGSGITGTFTPVLPLLNAGQWQVNYSANFLDLKVISTAPPSLDGDYNGDNVVDAADYAVWRKNVGQPLSGLPNHGSTTEDPIGSSQYDLWRTNFGNTSPGSGSSLDGSPAVPEPASILLVLIGCVALSGKRRR
jgi:hypothetical protein